MKKILLALVSCLLLLAACAKKSDTGAVPDTGPDSTATPTEISYAFGVSVGYSISEIGVTLEYQSFLEGLKDVLDKKNPKASRDEVNEQINTYLTALQQEQAKENLVKETAFFEENKKKSGIITTDSGLQYEVITQGTGEKPAAEDTVTVHYTGTLLDGTTFDSSVERDEPATFQLNYVIPGWTEGLQLMPLGSKYKMYIPSSLGYGPDGAGSSIPPNSTLIFEVELLDIQKADSQSQ